MLAEDGSSALEVPSRGSRPLSAKLPLSTVASRALDAARPTLAWLVVLLGCLALRTKWSHLSAALWGLLLLASFVAWGKALLRVLARRHEFGWGFEGSAGLALTFFVFGCLACVHLVSVGTVVAWSLGGPMAWGVLYFLEARSALLEHGPLRRWRRIVRVAQRLAMTFAAGLPVLYVMAGLQYVWSVTDARFNVYDDNGAYRWFARQFLESGTLYEPFSFRRISAYGGQSLGHALVLALSDRERLHIFDGGICFLLVLGLITGFRSVPRAGLRPVIFSVGLLAMTVLFTPHNTASELSGVVFFLALFRVLDHSRFEEASARSNAILSGLFTAAACTLRQNYLSAAVAYLALHCLCLVVFKGAKTRARWLAFGAMSGGAALLFVAPWMILSYVAARTPLYPIVKGTVRADYGFVGTVTWAEYVRWTLENLAYFVPIGSISLFFLAALLLPAARRNRALHAFLFSSAAAFLLMMYFFRNIDAADSIARYYFGFVVAFAFAAALRVLGEVASPRRRGGAFVAGGLVLVGMGMHFVAGRDGIRQEYSERVDALEQFLKHHKPPTEHPELEGPYGRLQNSVPRGATLLVMLDHPYLLDGARNPILDYDLPGAMGPKGGPPDFQGPDAFAQYMRSLGIRYIAYTLGRSSPEYQLELWQARADAALTPNGRSGFYKNTARFELDFFHVLTSLAASRAMLFHEGDMVVLDLEKPAR